MGETFDAKELGVTRPQWVGCLLRNRIGVLVTRIMDNGSPPRLIGQEQQKRRPYHKTKMEITEAM